ncbi:hypothetical protein ACN27F_18375 [Solwaraspora sp. WMMB335]|uniref:hypothetical protein n=1 Tax=Solwaraspora sp. WMMB335 TaxID=3404118 RepID=UPI003B9639EC
MMMLDDRKRRAELGRIAKLLKQLSLQPVPPMSGEKELRQQIRKYLVDQARFGIDDSIMEPIDEVIASYLIEIKSDLLRRHAAEEVDLGRLRADLGGLIAQYDHDRGSREGEINDLRYQRKGALRVIEDRDTVTPAGPNAAEEDGYQYGNVGVLAGRSRWWLLILYVALILAMAADFIMFRQVVERILNDSAVFSLVLALTVVTTYVAHLAGEAFQRAKQLRRNVRRALGGWLLSGLWLTMGVGTFVFRLMAPAPASSNAADVFVAGGGVPAGSADGSPLLSAVLLLLLYLLTGALAISAGYHSPRVEIAQFIRSNRRLKRRQPQLAVLLRDLAEAEALNLQIDDLQDSRKRQYAIEVDRCESVARRARAEAEILTRRLRSASGLHWLRRLTGGRRFGVPQAEVPDQGGSEPENNDKDEYEHNREREDDVSK